MLSFKRTTALLLTFVMILSIVAIPAYASGSTKENELESKMLRILDSVECEKEFYGLRDVDFNSITIGKEIPTYRVNGQNVEAADVQIFPVLNDGQVVSLFYATELPNGELYVQLGTELVQQLLPYAGDNEFAVVYDDLGVYVYTQGQFTQIGVAENTEDIQSQEITESNAISEEGEDLAVDTVSNLLLAELDNIDTSKITADMTLDVADNPASQNTPRAVVQRTLSVDIIQQPADSNVC